MTPVKYNLFDAWLSKSKPEPMPQIILVYGESYFVKQVFDKICDRISKKNGTQYAIETLEGGSVSIGDIIEEVSTFSFLVKQKVVVVKNIPLFQTQKNPNEISFDSSDHQLFSNFIENGMPDDHRLILTCSNIDKRKKIYKCIEDKGLIVDCSVAQGIRKADVDDQNQVLKKMADSILAQSLKSIAPQAFNQLVELTGFNLELFSNNLEKLIAYTGKNKAISIKDVKAVVVRDKKDPIFNLTNALMEKDTGTSLFYLNSLLTEGFHPLQILKSFENQVRKLLLVKCFVQELNKGAPMGFRQMGFNGFKQGVLNQIIDRDKQVQLIIKEQEASVEKEKGKKKKAVSNDLLLAPNPKNPYPVYQVFLKSENFSLLVLNQALVFLSDLDYALKTSAIDAKAHIESFIIQFCSKGGFVHDA